MEDTAGEEAGWGSRPAGAGNAKLGEAGRRPRRIYRPKWGKRWLRGGGSDFGRIRTQQERNRRERGKVSGRRVRREESYRKGEAGEENGSIGRAAGTEGEGG